MCFRYKVVTRQKLSGPVLNRLYSKCIQEQKEFLKESGYGRALTGDSATIMSTKFMNFLVHQYGKGVMLITIKDCTERLQEVGTIDSTFIAHEMIRAIRFVFCLFVNPVQLIIIMLFVPNREVGAKTIFLIVIDGGADWVATEKAVTDKYPWIHFMHCVGHEGSLIIKDICKIEEIDEVISFVTDAQKWFLTNKLGPLLQKFCIQHYGVSRAFIFPAETRFAGKLLQLKRFLSMKNALQQLVQSAQYLRFNFERDPFAGRISGGGIWDLIKRVTSTAAPVLLLLRLADTNEPTLSKLKGTVDYIKGKMIDTGTNTLEDKICVAFQNRSPELEFDISSAAYILDPQFIMKSRRAGADVMKAFWTVSRKVLRITDDVEWTMRRQDIVNELAKFRMQQGGFAQEDYSETCSHAFWGVAGCHAPNLRELAFRLTTLPCSSGEAERNWKEVKHNYTKDRNRIDRNRLEKIVFVRRFIRLKRKLCFNENTDSGFKEWINELLAEASKVSDSSSSETDEALQPFVDHIEPGEQGKINGKEPGEDQVSLTELKKDHAVKSWLFEKYYNMEFVDKNPEGEHGDGPLEDESEWEHRVVKDVVWFRLKGYSVETIIRGCNVSRQSIEKYLINDALHEMIRASPHNSRPMLSEKDESVFDSNSSDSDGEGSPPSSS